MTHALPQISAIPKPVANPAAELFQPYEEAFRAFAKGEPIFRLTGGEGSARHFKRTHRTTLLTSGACIRTPGGVWLADRVKFPVVARTLCLGPFVEGAAA